MRHAEKLHFLDSIGRRIPLFQFHFSLTSHDLLGALHRHLFNDFSPTRLSALFNYRTSWREFGLFDSKGQSTEVGPKKGGNWKSCFHGDAQVGVLREDSWKTKT